MYIQGGETSSAVSKSCCLTVELGKRRVPHLLQQGTIQHVEYESALEPESNPEGYSSDPGTTHVTSPSSGIQPPLFDGWVIRGYRIVNGISKKRSLPGRRRKGALLLAFITQIVSSYPRPWPGNVAAVSRQGGDSGEGAGVCSCGGLLVPKPSYESVLF